MFSVLQKNSDVLLKRGLKIQIIMDKALVCITDTFPYIIIVFKLEGNMKSIFICNADIWYSVQNVYLSVTGHKDMLSVVIPLAKGGQYQYLSEIM